MANGNGNPDARMAREAAWRALADQTLGRSQGPVLFDQINHTFAAAATLRPNRNLDATIPIKALLLILSGRVVIGVADYTTAALEIPQSLLQRIRLRGRHRTFGAQTLWDISGSTAFAWPQCFQTRGSWRFAGAAGVLNALGVPLTIPMAAGMLTAVGTVDFEVHYYLPTYPMLGPGPYEPRWAAPYYLRDEDWGSSLQLEVDMANNTGLGVPAAGTTTTWTAYGAATGTPNLQIYAIHSMLGPFARIPGRGIVLRSEDTAAPARVAAGVNLSLFQLRQAITSNIMIKTGNVLAGTSAGVEVFDVLSDRHLDRTKVVLNNKYLRDTEYNRAVKQQAALDWNVTQPEGYLNFSFIDSHNPLTSLRADKSTGMFELRTDVTAAIAAASQQHVIQEIITGGPFPA